MAAMSSAPAAKAVGASEELRSSPAEPRKGYAYGGAMRRFDAIEPTGSRFKLHGHPALREARSIFGRRVYEPGAVKHLLVSGHNSRKIGKRVTKGRWTGMPIFTLTLEERATCPRSCEQWVACYGNSMNWARRIRHGAEFEAMLWDELATKQREHPRGFVVRLHVLGDFYSEAYAELWEEALDAFPALRVFGYTAHDPESPIGLVIAGLLATRLDRFAVRFSGLDAPEHGSIVVDRAADTEHLVCPAQLGLTDCCGTCALCWHSTRTIAFLKH